MRAHGYAKSGSLLLMPLLALLPACGEKKSTVDMAASLKERLALKEEETLRAELGTPQRKPRIATIHRQRCPPFALPFGAAAPA
jgi:hypothetical protein